MAEKKQVLDERQPHSERLSETLSEKQKEEQAAERANSRPAAGGDGRKPHELQATKRSEMDELIEKREGKQAFRTPEEMSLHEEMSRTGKPGDWRSDGGESDRSKRTPGTKRPRKKTDGPTR